MLTTGQGTPIRDEQTFSSKFSCNRVDTGDMLIKEPLYGFDADGDPPLWFEEDNGMYPHCPLAPLLDEIFAHERLTKVDSRLSVLWRQTFPSCATMRRHYRCLISR